VDTSKWELAHIGIAVGDLDAAVNSLSVPFGDNWRGHSIDHDWLAPLAASNELHVRGRAMWAVGSNPPIELLEGAEGSPWHLPAGAQQIHHVSYWAPNLTTQVGILIDAGFLLEYTMPPTSPDEIRGFAYLINEKGVRIELQPESDKAGINRWLEGGPLELEWGFKG
jgi:hypothetical protein